MEPVKVFIVEDEAITVAVLSAVLEKAGYKVCGHSDNAEQAFADITSTGADIALLDINLAGNEDGVWLAEQINSTSKIPFIYLTSFGDKNTIERAVRTRPYGYLLKPFDDKDIFDSINLAMHNYGQQNRLDSIPDEELAEAVNVKDYLFIRDKNLFKKVHFKNILYLQVDKNYVDVVTTQTKYTIRTVLKELIPTLKAPYFAQVNRSAVVNIHFVDSYGPDSVSIGGSHLSLTYSYREQFHATMNNIG